MKNGASLLLVIVLGWPAPPARAEEPVLQDDWKRSELAQPRFQIQGTLARSNSLRRALREPYSGDELFVRYRMRYDAKSIDAPDQGDGEFLVLWLDEAEGGDFSTHSSGVPNLGLHVQGGENRFMARFRPDKQAFGPKLTGDRDYLIVGRLGKSSPGADRPYDQLDLWVDPAPDRRSSPDATAGGSSSIREVRWIGVGTGRKTELGDRIQIWDVAIADGWQAILGLPPLPRYENEATPQPERTVAFADDVYPILKARCFECHAGEDAAEGVRLDVLDELLNQTAPRDAENSRLYQAVSTGEMPADGERLDDRELALLRAWIEEGLDWDEKLLPTPVPQTDHWAFQPIRRPAIPEVRNREWVRTPVDAFVARRHEQLGLEPAPEANRETLHRRLSLDMLGLPPDPADEHPADPAAEIDLLLTHPAYSERWARHWLDVARWAESNGYQHNRDRAFAWRYRDWVIDAFARDMPFDDFLRAQVAGDEISPYRDANLVATGFLAAARYSGNELDKEIQRNDLLVDVANTTAKAFLGLTFECAQCHTHKFDPITIRDYYRFQAFFANGQPGNVVFASEGEPARDLVEERWRIFDSVHARLVSVRRKQGHPEPIYVIPKTVVAGMNPKEKSRFQELENAIAGLEQSWSFYSPATAVGSLVVAPHDMRWPLPRDPAVLEQKQTMLLIRGDVEAPGPVV
ncbi:MAG: DUF1549 domain-containing protein, partial [Planctomycetes bacterium]|nr:DUF1549 domain-containing protein [Planctomycetota bacterium]